MAEKINELAPDVLFWTGDVPPHDQWNYSQTYEERYQAWLFTFMQENLNSWSTYPLEGNHDFGVVINSQDFLGPTDPIIPVLANYWKAFLSEEAIAEFSINGYYSDVLRTSNGTVYPHVRVIAVNTEACYNSNYFNMGNRNDPGGILAWLEETLYKMEATGQIGIIIGHHPPGNSSTLYQWSKRF